MSLAALTVLAVGFSACSSGDDVDDAVADDSATDDDEGSGDDAGGDSGDDDDGDSGEITTSVPAPIDDDGFLLAIVEVGFGPDGYVTLENTVGSDVSLAGLHLCTGSACAALPDTTVAGEERVYLALGEGEFDGPSVPVTGIELNPADGEAAVHGSDDVTNPQDLRDYVQWGSSPHETTPVAVEAGQWIEGAYANSSDRAVRLYIGDDNQWVPDPPDAA